MTTEENIHPNTGKEILGKFIGRLGKGKLWPPMNSYSLFYLASGFNTKKYFERTPYENHHDFDALNLSNGLDSAMYLPLEPITNDSIEGFKKYLSDPLFIKNLEKGFYENMRIVDELYKAYSYDRVGKEDLEDLYPIVEQSFDLIHISNSNLYFCIYFDKEICFSVISSANLPISKERFDELWERATIPAFRSFDTTQEVEALSLISEGKSIDDIAEECQYFFANYRDAKVLSETKKMLKEKYGDLDAIAAAEKVKEILTREKRIDEEYKQWYEELSTEEKMVATHCQAVMKARDNRKNFFAKVFVIYWRISERALKEAGIEPKYIRLVLPNRELMMGVEFLKSKKGEIEKREKGYVVLVSYEGEVYIAYDDCTEIKKEMDDYYFKDNQQKSTTEIKGQIGCRGLVTGKVKIILDVNRSDHFEVGDILVTGMTRPEFVPLMKKATAIVTDEGGITCHAAIVSRELNKPCIIGTRIATKMLKDGDTVEVDANKGVVKIL